jgi:hypothetical protein
MPLSRRARSSSSKTELFHKHRAVRGLQKHKQLAGYVRSITFLVQTSKHTDLLYMLQVPQLLTLLIFALQS